MKIYLIDRNDSTALFTLDLSPLWPEQAQELANQHGGALVAILGNEAGEFRPAEVNEPAKEERP